MATPATAPAPQLQLPPGFEDAQPVSAQTSQPPVSQSGGPSGVQLPPGFEDAQPVNAPKPPGFVSTVGSDLYNMGKTLVQLPGKELHYGGPSPEEGQQLQANQEAHQKQVYQKFAQDFHAGHYANAVGSLWQLFDPHYSDPNDPLDQVMSAQWDSSAQAKQRMLDAAKKGDALGVVQHAAGIIPVASQVDAAMENYRKQPTRENLAHVVTSAVPAFVPSMMRGVAKAAPVVSDAAGQLVDAAKEAVNPATEEEVGGQTVAARKTGTFANQVAKIAPQAIQKLINDQVAPSTAEAISNISKDVTGTDREFAPTETDRFHVEADADAQKALSQDTYKAVDEATGNKLTDAQNAARKAWAADDNEAYSQAISDKEAAFKEALEKNPDHPALQGDAMKEANTNWSQALAKYKIAHDYTEYLTKASDSGGQWDYKLEKIPDIVDKLARRGVYEDAGYLPEEVQALKDLGQFAKKQANVPQLGQIFKLSSTALGGLAGSTLLGGWGIAGGSYLGHEFLAPFLKSGAQKFGDMVVGKVMTTPAAAEAITDGLKAGTPPPAIATKIANLFSQDSAFMNHVKALVTGDKGELGLPGTVFEDSEIANMKAKETDLVSRLKSDDDAVREPAWKEFADSGTDRFKSASSGSKGSKAWNATHKFFRDKIANSNMGRVRLNDLADDLTQETFVGASKGIKNFNGESSLNTWLRSIAKNKLQDYYEKTGWAAPGQKAYGVEPNEAALREGVKDIATSETSRDAASDPGTGQFDDSDQSYGIGQRSADALDTDKDLDAINDKSSSAYRTNPENILSRQEQSSIGNKLEEMFRDPRFKTLNPVEKQLLRERFVDESDFDDIARSRKITAAAARQRVSRALAKIHDEAPKVLARQQWEKLFQSTKAPASWGEQHGGAPQ